MRFISPLDCKKRLDNNEVEVVDIREPYEFEACNAGFRNIPMAELTLNIEKLDSEKDHVIMCKSGKRAEAIVNFLETEHKITNLIVLEGGITEWANQIDNTLQLD
ncbi:MAG: rhodanese-like domain-containing protein [Bacteroidota bacterium]